MVPRLKGKNLEYAVAKAKLDQEVWPIGWPPEKPPAEVLPAMFEFHNVNVQNVSAAKTLDAVSKLVSPGAPGPQRPGPARHRPGQGDGFDARGPDDL